MSDQTEKDLTKRDQRKYKWMGITTFLASFASLLGIIWNLKDANNQDVATAIFLGVLFVILILVSAFCGQKYLSFSNEEQ